MVGFFPRSLRASAFCDCTPGSPSDLLKCLSSPGGAKLDFRYPPRIDIGFIGAQPRAVAELLTGSAKVLFCTCCLVLAALSSSLDDSSSQGLSTFVLTSRSRFRLPSLPLGTTSMTRPTMSAEVPHASVWFVYTTATDVPFLALR